MAFRFAFRDTDRGLLRVAAEHAKAAGKTASTACAKAECTQGQGEADSLVGYSDENLKRIEQMEHGVVELGRNNVMALMTGLRLYADEQMKLQQKEGALLISSDVEERMDDNARCQRILRHLDEPELPLDPDMLPPVEVPDEDGVVEGANHIETISFNGGTPVPYADFERAANEVLDAADAAIAKRAKKRIMHRPADPKAKKKPKARR